MNKELKINYELYPRAQYVKDPVIIDGFSRSGKFLLGHLVGAMEGVEFMQNPILLETALYLIRLNKLDLDTARILVQTDIDFNTYNMAIGRGLNTRIEDSSCIYKAVDFGKFLSRTTMIDPDLLIDEFQQKKSLPLYIGHECLCNIRSLFSIYPEMRMINLQRDPLALITSWYRRGWGRRFGVDPKSVSIAFMSDLGPVPWFGLDWIPSYIELNEMDRIIKSIETLSRFARSEYECLTSKEKSQIHFVRFNEILSSTYEVIEGVSSFLNRSPSQNIGVVLARERIPRIVPENQRKNLLQEVRVHMSPNMNETLDMLLEDFDNFWVNLT
jgi:hypothetical protein